MLQGVRDYAHEHGAWNLDLQPGGLNQVLPQTKTWKGHGIISRAAKPGLFTAILKTGLPTVFFTLSDRQRNATSRSDILEVFVDADSVGQSAADHLLGRGFRHFAFVGHAQDTDWSKRRERALARGLAGSSIRPHVFPLDPKHAENWPVEGRRMAKWIRKLPKPVGIMAANDARGLQILDACRQGGVTVPDEVAVIGVDNDELICTLCDPPLTTITLATADAGYRAAQALHALMLKQPPGTRQILIQARHILGRQSTETAVAPDWRVEKARKFILKQASEMIQVRQVVEHVGVSRRSLEAHFAESVGHSILKEILGVRIERVKALLHGSTKPLEVIARGAGFSQANYMCKAFRKAIGCSPQEYRRQSHRTVKL